MKLSTIGTIFSLAAAIYCTPPVEGDPMEGIAEDYVRLVLAVGHHDSDYVDAYYGPQEWRDEADAEGASLGAIRARAENLRDQLEEMLIPSDELDRLRLSYLRTQLGSLIARVGMLQGERLSFDEESRALYGAVAPANTEAYFEAVLDGLDSLLPGTGPLAERYNTFRSQFVIPTEKLDTVFLVAINACRERTEQFLELPEGENFVVEYVTDKSWSGYNWYKGGFQSLIQVNTDFPIYIDRAIDLACHEGYPGHHVYNAMLERSLVNEKGWVEFSVNPLFSPQSLIAEGSANFGIEMAFPGDERITFESDVLYPLAGLDPASAQNYHHIQKLMEGLSYAGNEAARRYLDGDIDAAAAALWLQQFAMFPPDRAAQRVRFIDQYRSYVINYNLGQDLVRGFVDGDGDGNRETQWERFRLLLTSPRLPGDL